MDNPVNTVKSAARSALTFKSVLALLIGLLLLAAIADAAGVWNWLFRPVSTFKTWNAARKSKATN
jgi:hypothetical protein